MKFDKKEVYWWGNSEEAEKLIGRKGWFADTPLALDFAVRNSKPLRKLKSVDTTLTEKPFIFGADSLSCYRTAYFYPAPEPRYKPYNGLELIELIGAQVKRKNGENRGKIDMVIFSERNKPICIVDEFSQSVGVGMSFRGDAEWLFDSYVFEDRTPCGVQED